MIQADRVSSSKIADFFAAFDEVLVVYLFGSQARGDATPLSDFDFAVLLTLEVDARQSLDLRLTFIDELQGLLQTDLVDVVILSQAPLALQYRVLRDGHVLFCRDKQQRVLFQADVVSRYLDFKPFIERHEKALLARARRGELLDGHNPHRGALAHYLQLRERDLTA
ncbi:MAG: nucleotidyltransferase domain-containing protein [Caldilineaceae bacterium]|nr:nucleotidyltransferase domain-containing protein [Caldilineaceae bacterium]